MKVYITGSSAITPQQTFVREQYLEPWKNEDQQYLTAIEPEYRDIIDPKLSRRMSRIIKMGIAAAFRALENAQVEQPGAIITGTGLGCIADTEKFLHNIIQEEEGLLSPTAFIQSTHNTVAGQLAMLLQCASHNLTYVNRGHSFENALLDGILKLQEGTEDVLVGGIDEMTPLVFDIIQKMGCGQNTWGEGASFFVLSADNKQDAVGIADLHIFNKPAVSDLNVIIKDFLEKNNIEAGEVDALLVGQRGEDPYYSAFFNCFDKTVPVVNFKKITGEYFTAAAYAYELAAMMLRKQQVYQHTLQSGDLNRSLRKVLIYNHYLGANQSLALLSL